MLLLSFLVIEILIFGILVMVLRHVLMSPMGRMSRHLEKLNEDYTKKLEEAKKQKEEAGQYYQQTIARTKEETERLKQQLIQEGHEAGRQALAEKRQQGEEIIRRAQVASDAMIQEIEKRIQAEALVRAREWLLQMLPGKMAEETHSRWVEAFLENGFEGWNRFQVAEKTQEAEVLTAFPLKPGEKKKLEAQLSKASGKVIQIREKVDPHLILGIRLTIDSLVVDGSFQSKIVETLRNVPSE